MARLPVLIAFSGLPGSGKSTLSQRLAHDGPALWLSIDTIERAILASGATLGSIGDAGYRVAQAMAADALRGGLSVVTDCVNPWMLARDAWRDCGEAAGARVIEVEVVCSDAVEHRARVERRRAADPQRGWPDWAAVLARDYQAWTRPCLRVDTAHQPLEAGLEALRRAVAAQ